MSKEEDQIEGFPDFWYLFFLDSVLYFWQLLFYGLCLCTKEAVADNVNRMKNNFVTLIMTKYQWWI